MGFDGVDAPVALVCYSGGVEHHLRVTSMGEASIIGLDLAKSAFQVDGADASGTVLFRRKLSSTLANFGWREAGDEAGVAAR